MNRGNGKCRSCNDPDGRQEASRANAVSPGCPVSELPDNECGNEVSVARLFPFCSLSDKFAFGGIWHILYCSFSTVG